MENKDSILKKSLSLFGNAFITSMTANSGYAIVSVLKNKYTQKHKWVSEEEMNAIVALCQSSPGPIAVSSNLMIGFQIAGPLGAFASVLGCIIPPIIMMILVSFFYNYIITNRYVRIFMQGMQAGVIAMLLDVVIGLFMNIAKKREVFLFALMIIAFLYLRLFDLSIVYLLIFMIVAALVKTLIMTIQAKKGGKA